MVQTERIGVPTSKPTNEYVLNVAFVSFLGFTILQLFFATLAKSQAMMEDCIAMSIDVITYLFNFLAERFKHRVGRNATISTRDSRLYCLYLELVPPFISVVTLLVVTIMGLMKAIETLRLPTSSETLQPNLHIMLVLSALNLLLDIGNATCFARVNQALGLAGLQACHDGACASQTRGKEVASESTALIPGVENGRDQDDSDEVRSQSSDDMDTSEAINLNMCSAWTHICADTLRSVAVLVAAGIAAAFPSLLTPAQADSWGAVVVSVIILISLVPLFDGLYLTAGKIHRLWWHENC